MRKTDGFTLIELMVGIVCSALVTGAVITFMLAGMDTNRSVLDANTNQRNAKIILSMVENLANEGSIAKLEVDGDLTIENGKPTDDGKRSWTLFDRSGNELLYFSPSEKTIYGRNKSILMENINASMLSMSKAPLGGCILGFGLQTDNAFYKTSVYNRTSTIDTTGIVLDENNFTITDTSGTNEIGPDNTDSRVDVDSRTKFLQTLTSQYGSTGTIIYNGTVSPIPYSLWYCGGAYPENDSSWSENTPWCAIFISWAIAQNESNLRTETYPIPFAAEVYDNNSSTKDLWNSVQQHLRGTPNYNIIPGDLIFFDWDGKTGDDFDLEHVGVILYTDSNWIYTIEGNSGDRVALRRYEINNSYIHGYGRLDWKNETIS